MHNQGLLFITAAHGSIGLADLGRLGLPPVTATARLRGRADDGYGGSRRLYRAGYARVRVTGPEFRIAASLYSRAH